VEYGSEHEEEENGRRVLRPSSLLFLPVRVTYRRMEHFRATKRRALRRLYYAGVHSLKAWAYRAAMRRMKEGLEAHAARLAMCEIANIWQQCNS